MTLAKFHNYTKAKVFEFRRLQTLQTASISVPYQVDPEFIIINCDNAHTRCYLYAVGPDAYNGIRSHRACTRISWLRLINSWIRELQLQRNTIYESFIYALICVSYHRRRIGVRAFAWISGSSVAQHSSSEHVFIRILVHSHTWTRLLMFKMSIEISIMNNKCPPMIEVRLRRNRKVYLPSKNDPWKSLDYVVHAHPIF